MSHSRTQRRTCFSREWSMPAPGHWGEKNLSMTIAKWTAVALPPVGWLETKKPATLAGWHGFCLAIERLFHKLLFELPNSQCSIPNFFLLRPISSPIEIAGMTMVCSSPETGLTSHLETFGSRQILTS